MLEKVLKGSVPSPPKAVKKVTNEILALTDSNAQRLRYHGGASVKFDFRAARSSRNNFIHFRERNGGSERLTCPSLHRH